MEHYTLVKRIGEQFTLNGTIYYYHGVDENKQQAKISTNEFGLNSNTTVYCDYYEEYTKTTEKDKYIAIHIGSGVYLKTYIPETFSKPILLRHLQENTIYEYYLLMSVNNGNDPTVSLSKVERGIQKKLEKPLQLIHKTYVEIEAPKYELRTHYIHAHGGSACPLGSLQTFKLPPNVVVIMNCYKIVSYGEADNIWPLTFDNIFKDIRLNFQDLRFKMFYLRSIQQLIAHEKNPDFCVFTEDCPNIMLKYIDNNRRMGIYELPIELKQNYAPITQNDEDYAPITQRDHDNGILDKEFCLHFGQKSSQTLDGTYTITSLHYEETCRQKGINCDKDSEKNRDLQSVISSLSGEQFHVVVAQSCRDTHAQIEKQHELGVSFTSVRDPSFFSIVFNKFNQTFLKLPLQNGRGLSYKYNVLGKERDFTYKDSNLWTKYDRKWVSLLDTLLLEDKLALRHIGLKAKAKDNTSVDVDVYTKVGKTHKCKDGKVRALYSKGKSFYVKMKGMGDDGGKYEYKRVRV